MRLEVVLDGQRYRADLDRPKDLSRPVRPGEESLAFSLPGPREAPVHLGSFVGDVREGGSVNCTALQLHPHGDGTHTECVGHVLEERVFVAELLPPALMPCLVVTAAPTRLEEAGEAYEGTHAPNDLVITARVLKAALSALESAPRPAAVVVRTGSGVERFGGTNPPYFTPDAISALTARGTAHVLTDLPSLDREDDGGALCSHRRLWGLRPGQRALFGQAPSRRTVTELCQIPNHMPDGSYLLSLQVPAVFSDAAPSRPVLYALERA